ncbi:hypothetical protein EZV62_007906 [Acer yangbiense]|uniref:60S ribosomal protein L18a-like protein n=1 Tax=Acer yangbiense TaxID=1000413 RepID=A0A5C7IBX4_9ROSI|nr:hypothetical protein EZV62_007906 [Acer yangbiense]
MSEDDKNRGIVVDHHHHQHQHHEQQPQPQPLPPPQYGTFQGVANYPPPQPPAVGFPQPVPPPGATSPPYYPHGYQAVPGFFFFFLFTLQLFFLYDFFVFVFMWIKILKCDFVFGAGYAVAEGRPVRQRRLPCCGIGIGWFLFIIGFFLGAIPWYLGLFVMLCARIDHREKPGYIACTIAVSKSFP